MQELGQYGDCWLTGRYLYDLLRAARDDSVCYVYVGQRGCIETLKK